MRFVLVLSVALALLLAACVAQQTQVNTANTTPTGAVVTETQVIRETIEIPEGKGRLIVALTSANSVPGVNSVRMTVDNVEVYSATDGWVTVNGDEETYELVNLPGRYELLGDRVLDAEQYTAVRMKISSITVSDATQTYNAVLPTDTFIYNLSINLATGGTSTVTFDVVLDQTVRRTTDGRFVALPVMRVLAREGATISVQQDRIVAIEGPIIIERVYGTTVRGETAPDVVVPPATVIVVENGVIRETTTVVNETRVINNTVVQNNTVIVNNTENDTRNATNTTRNVTRSTWPTRTTNRTNTTNTTNATV